MREGNTSPGSRLALDASDERSFDWGRTMRIAGVVFALLAITFLATLPRALSAQDEVEDGAEVMEEMEGWRPSPAVVQREESVKRSLESLEGHPWAGVYYKGDGLGANIRFSISPTGGASATWHGCMGLYGSNEGNIEERPDGSLRFAFTQPNKDEFGGFSDAALPVAWGERRYLIPPADLLEFVNAINMRWEPRKGVHGMFLLRDDDEQKEVEGVPQLPAEYLALIRAESRDFPIVRIDEVDKTGQSRKRVLGEACYRTYRVIFDPQSDPQLRVGTELLLGPPGDWETAEITTIAAGRGEAEAEFYLDSCEESRESHSDWQLITGGTNFDRFAAK